MEPLYKTDLDELHVPMNLDQIPNDSIMPSQYADARRKARDEPEQMLVLAVLEDAMMILDRYKPLFPGVYWSTKQRKLYEEAEYWVRVGDEGKWTFDWCCEVLDLNPEVTRKRALAGIRLSSSMHIQKGNGLSRTKTGTTFQWRIRAPVTRRKVGDTPHNAKGHNQWGCKGKPKEEPQQVWP
jgi:hypothetical protein